MRDLLRHRWRQDRLPLLLFLVTFIVMTYPFVFHMHDSLPIHISDTFKALWQNWWLREALVHGHDTDFSANLFYPLGLDVDLDPRRWTTFPIWTLLYTILGDPLAFNLLAMFGALFKAYGMYLFCTTLFKRQMPAWVAGAFYAFAAPALALALRQPNTGATEWIPWFMLCLAYAIGGLHEGRSFRFCLGAMFLAGICFSLNMYMNLKIAVFALLLGSGYIVWRMFVDQLWARRRFWVAAAIFALTATVVSSPLLIRTLRSSQFDFAIDRPVITEWWGNVDLLNYISADRDWPANTRQVIASLSGDHLEIGCLCRGMAHVGVVGVVFAVMGAVYILRFRRRETIWVILSVLAFLLSLGVVFHVNGEALDIYWTPYRLLQDNFFFRALWHPFRMIMVFLFPFSILVGYGLHARLRTLRLDRAGWFLLVVSVAMLLYGTSLFPLAMFPSPRPAYLSVLATLPEGAVIDLPMGRHNAKYYMSLQRFHGRPMVEGMLPRTPPNAYDYINVNPVLARLYHGSSGEPPREAEWRTAVDSLIQDGFRYVIMHERVPQAYARVAYLPDRIADDFSAWPTVYQDEDVRIYDLWRREEPVPVLFSGGFSYIPTDANYSISAGNKFTVHRWALHDSRVARPCQAVTVESWWSIKQRDATPHSLLLILADSDGDGQLALAEKPPADRFTTEWRPGVYYHDKSDITIPCTIAAGDYPLLLAMKESMSGKTLQFTDVDGASIGSHYYLTTIQVAGG